MLLLKRHLVELVRAGKKRQTVRLWTKQLLRAGQVSFTPGLGRMLITAVDELGSLAELTEADARADGFASLKELRAEITKIYGPKPVGRKIFRIKFEWPIDGGGAVPAAKPAVEALHEKSPPDKPSREAPVAAPAATKRQGAKPMTAAQRRSLKAYILGNAPRG